MFHGSFKSIPRKFLGKFGIQVRLKGISRSYMGVSRAFERSPSGVSGKFQWSFKEVSKIFQGSFKSVSR